MIECVTRKSVAESGPRLAEIVNAHSEWFATSVSRRTGSTSLLRRSECEFSVARNRLIFSSASDDGVVALRVVAWDLAGEKLCLEVTSGNGADAWRVELVPRASYREGVDAVTEARRARCIRLAELFRREITDAQVERVALSPGMRRNQPGRYARIVLRRRAERIAVTADSVTSERGNTAALLSSALIWFGRLAEGAAKTPARKLWLAAPPDSVEPLRRLLLLLRTGLREDVALYQIDDDWQQLKKIPLTGLEALLAEVTPRLPRLSPRLVTESAANITAFAPEAIDVVRSRRGETLRFHGLGFARVRRLMNREGVWFGIDGARRRSLSGDNADDLAALLRELDTHRRAGAAADRNALFRAAPEAWLESSLRRDISQLDPGLVVAPIHAQLRAPPGEQALGGGRPIDLLARRRDGRLVVIELKVSEDREFVFQGAEYWSRIESHRRAGHIARARLFGNAVIADQSPLVYLVAPIFRYHRAFSYLARCLSPEIEVYRFDINEDWRAGVRVLRRQRLT